MFQADAEVCDTCKRRSCSTAVPAAPLDALTHLGRVRMMAWHKPLFASLSRRVAIMSRMAVSPSAVDTVLVYPRERSQAESCVADVSKRVVRGLPEQETLE